MSIEHSEFLKSFPIPLHHRQPGNLWVYWTQDHEGCQNYNTSAANRKIQEKIKHAFSNITLEWWWFLAQFWAPVTIGSRHVLSTSGQPFAVSHHCEEFTQYRLYAEKYHYIIDHVNNKQLDLDQPEHMMIMSGGPATAFLDRLPYFTQLQWVPLESSTHERLNFSIMLPIRLPSQNDCIGVLEFTLDFWIYCFEDFFFNVIMAIKEAGLDVFYAANLIPCKTLTNLKLTKDKIKEALKIVCGTHNLALAQVWITFEDKYHMPLSVSSSSEDTRTKHFKALKLTGYLYAVTKLHYDNYEKYYTLCDVIPHGIGADVAPKTLQDYESRYISNLHSDYMITCWDDVERYSETSALVICLRSNDTGEFNYAFEFIWLKRSKYAILLEALLLTIKRCLPSFKFACGAELGDEIDVIDVQASTNSEDDEIAESVKLKIFQVKRSSPMLKALEEGKKSMVVDYIGPSEVASRKRTLKVLTQEVIEEQFGNTMVEAAKNLDVSKSTLKRKLRKLGIMEWPGPTFVKRNTNDSSIVQINTNVEDNRATQKPSTINISKNTLTIKAEYGDNMIKFRLPVLQATFVKVDKEIGMKFNLCLGTYKLKYQDEVGDWILLTSNEEMNYCIESSRKIDPNEVRLLVLPSTQPIFGTSCSYGICST